LFITAPILTYTTPDGLSHPITRNFDIKFNTLTWTDKGWSKVVASQTVILPTTQKSVSAPYCNTFFTMSGDQFSTALGMDSIKKASSSEYTTNAVICKASSNLSVRDSTNEDQRPKVAEQLNGSAPLDIQFLSNANEPVAQYYNWEIYKNNALIINRKDKDHRYTFTEKGTYKVKVTASNSICSYSDSLTVGVSESAIFAPNVFTPNGDGINDEFRVAYKSIISFQCWVYNRWGREVYTWTDPQKGWDGKINGKNATPGPYFYVIKALGSDYDPTSTPDQKTHLRLGEYLLKGDINLLRGAQ
jgi:gliding motility-associated-like protein